jgi:hypothetical protein
MVWCPEGEIIDPEGLYAEVDLVTHKDTFKFGEHYEIIEYP